MPVSHLCPLKLLQKSPRFWLAVLKHPANKLLFSGCKWATHGNAPNEKS